MSDTEPRDIVEVIQQIQDVIKDQPHCVPLHQRLEHLKQSARFTAPEISGTVWPRVQAALGEELGRPHMNEIADKVRAIFAGTT